MTHERVEKNIYRDERCTKYPYFVSIMKHGHKFYKKFKTMDECRIAKQEFIEKFTLQPTDHPLLFLRNDTLIMEVTVYKEFDTWDDAVRKAELIQRFIDS